MIQTPQAKAALARYQSDSILSATPGQLVTMLYGRLVLDLRRAEAAQLEQDWVHASSELVHAQAIVAELSSALRPDVWEGGTQLLGIYTYATRLLVDANVKRDIEPTREALALLEPLKIAWDEAAATLAGAPAAADHVA
ncbi:flagellar export chaperone FliS [Lysobacter korlensis]|uniref:Flagellar export chaperone FliS n=1 Tax=Lysobacter korlensis TaxID=553636 RepID=A0ABV6RUN5_9GAMM